MTIYVLLYKHLNLSIQSTAKLVSTIFQPEFLKEIPSDWNVSKKYALKTIERIKDKQARASIYRVNDYSNPIEVVINGLDGQKNLIMKPIENLGLVRPIDSNCVMVLCDDLTKNQFLVSNLRISDGLVIAPLPNELVKIQRRNGARELTPVDGNLKLVLHLGAGQELETKLINIGPREVQIDYRKTALEPILGRIWFNSCLERGSSKSKSFTPEARHISKGADIDRIRCGCVLLDPTKENLSDFKSTCAAIADSRAAGTPNNWYKKTRRI
jgi:hypothetical protein